MAGSPASTRDLLHQAKAAREAGDLDSARTMFAKAYDAARQVHDVDAMGEAALGLSADQSFGTHPGRVPAFLFETFQQSEGAVRARLAAALVRAWVYGGSPARGVEFAKEAVRLAETEDDQTLLAEALDAQLLVHWGPDHLEDRLRITSRLENAVAHVADVEARMSAHLWRLTTAVEGLDMPTARRQLRALDLLADESGSMRARFFAEARRGMHAIVVGDLDTARAHRGAAIVAGTAAGEADTFAINHALSAAIARQAGDVDTLRIEAELFEEFGTSEGYLTVAVEAASLWVAGGELDRARSLLRQLVGAGLSDLPRDLDWLLVVSRSTETAAATGELDLAAEGYALLEPYAGRGLANAGAAMFDGVVDGFLGEAAAALDRAEDAVRWRSRAASLAERFGARWWVRTFSDGNAGSASPHAAVLRPAADGVWTVGRAGATSAVREVKGFHYLRLLLTQPGIDLSALQLSDWVAGHPGRSVDAADTGDVIDRQALTAYRARLADLATELDEATAWADEGRRTRLHEERDTLLDEIDRATGLGRRIRRSGATTERARVAVRKAIAAAIDRVTEVDQSLGRLLRDCIQTGTVCRYDPDPARPLTWSTDTEPPRVGPVTR